MKSAAPRAAAELPSLALACVAAAAAFAASLGFEQLRDDASLIAGRADDFASLANLPRYFAEGFWPRALRHASGDYYYRPLVTVLNAFNFLIAGAAPWAYHLVNVLLHTLNVALLHRALLRLGGRVPALAGACLWALHPAVVPSVAWISGRTDLLCATFLLASFGAWLAFVDEGRPRSLALALALHATALFAKELALVFPAVAAVTALTRGPGRRRALAAAALFFIGDALYLAARHAVLSEDTLRLPADADLGAQIASALSWLGYDLRKLVLPRPLVFLPNAEPIAASVSYALVGGGALVAGAALSFLLRRTAVPVGVAWLCAFLLPVLGLVPIPFPGAAYYLYLPLAGLVIALVPAVAWLWARPLPAARRAAPLGALVALAAAGTAARLPDYASAEALCRADLDAEPDNVKALMSCAEAAIRRGETAAANRLLADAARGAPDDPVLLFNYALSFQKLGDAREAERLYRRALDADPELPQALGNLGLLLIERGRCDDALPILRRARTASPGDAWVAGALIACDNSAGRFDDAQTDFRDAGALAPRSPIIQVQHGHTLWRLGRTDEAEAAFRGALELDARFALAHRALAALYEQRGDARRADEHRRLAEPR